MQKRGTMSSGAQMQHQHERPNSERGGVVVLDFGGQYTQLIARRIREQQVFSSVLPCTTTLDEIRKLEPTGIVLSGGPSSVYDAQAPKCDPAVLSLGIPVLGICYGMQWLTYHLGGKVEPAARREYGSAVLNIDSADNQSELFVGVPRLAAHLEQPRRPRRGASSRLSHRGPHAKRGCRRRRPSAQNLCCRVSSRGAPHRSRHRNSSKFSIPRLQGGKKVERRGLHRGNH